MMRKTFIWIGVFLLLTQFCLGVGVSPARKVLDFSPNLETKYELRVINNDDLDFKALVYVEGDLKQYIKPEKSLLTFTKGQSEQILGVSVKLPEEMTIPGMHMGKVTILHVPENYFDNQGVLVVTPDQEVIFNSGEGQSQIMATAGVASQVLVNVPYPGTYAKAKLHIDEGGVDSPIVFTVALYNFGKEKIQNAYARVRILGANNEEIIELRSNDISLDPSAEGKVIATWSGKHNPGAYHAEVYLQYDDQITELGDSFKVGRLFIRIKDLDISAFRLGEIAKLEFTVESDWNEPIQEVSGDVLLLDKEGLQVDTFQTIERAISPKLEELISAYWDTEGLSVGEYDLNLNLDYEGQSSSKLFETVVSLDKAIVKDKLAGRVIESGEGSNSYNLLVILVAVLIAFNVGIFIYLKKKR